MWKKVEGICVEKAPPNPKGGTMYYRILSGLGVDDIIFIILLIVGLLIIRYWLIKIYRRVRQISLILAHFYRQEKEQ